MTCAKCAIKLAVRLKVGMVWVCPNCYAEIMSNNKVIIGLIKCQ